MKKFNFKIAGCLLAVMLPLATTLAQSAPSPKTAPAKPLNVAILVYPGVEALDMSGALDVFVKASEVAPNSFKVFTVAKSRAPFDTENGVLTLTPQFDIASCPRPDIVIVPGSSTARVAEVGSDARVQKWLRANATPKQTVMSVCTGAFIIGSAGLLDNKNSTTHWFVQSDFQKQFPKTKAFSGARFVRDGNIISTAGVSSGIDGALQLVEDIKGKQVADLVASALQYRRGTPSFPEQPHERVKVQTASSPLKKGQKFALDIDPICHMKVGAATTNTFVYKGKTYGFCSPGCRDAFATHPEHFLR